MKICKRIVIVTHPRLQLVYQRQHSQLFLACVCWPTPMVGYHPLFGKLRIDLLAGQSLAVTVRS